MSSENKPESAEAVREKTVQVGRVKDAHGIKGELFITLFAGEAAWLDKLKGLQLFADSGATKDFSIKTARLHKNGLIVKTNEIKDRNEAETLIGWFLHVPEEFLVSAKGEALYLREVLGFRVITKSKGEVGVIKAFSSNGIQDLLVVETSWGEFAIPFVEAFVERMDFESKQIFLDLPEGLLGELEGEEG